MLEWLEIGSTPPEEDCAQLGSEGYYEKAKPECRRYIEAIRAKLGPERGSAQLRIRSNPHDFGTYYEVACYYEEDDSEALQYALWCESIGPATWDDTQRLENPQEQYEACNRRWGFDENR